MDRTLFWAVPFLGLIGGPAWGSDAPPALTVRLVRPDLEGERLLALFQGSRSPHPAAALAAWKRATRGNLGKAREALIALLNPAMVPELKTLDEAALVLRFDPGDGHARWHALVPHDDGTVSALATALVLTDGMSAPALGIASVDRLGPPGAPLMARAPGVLALAGSREDLEGALGPDPTRAVDCFRFDSGFLFRIDPRGLGRHGPVPRRQAAEVLRALGCRDVEGVIRLEGEAVEVEITTRLDAPAYATLDPDWLDGIPASAAAMIAFALDPGPEAWDRAFAVADRVEHADPARAGLAPLRTRLNLIALAAKIRLELDLWPQLRGLSLTVLADPEGEVSGALLTLHAADTVAAERLAHQVIPRLTASWVKGARLRDEPDGTGSLGRVADRPLRLARRGTTILIGWGDSALKEALDARDHPERSAGAMVRSAWGSSKPPQRAGAFWPGRLRRLAPAGSPLALALQEAPPVLWSGRNEAQVARDEFRWTDLRGPVRRFLERLPLDPPPHPGGP